MNNPSQEAPDLVDFGPLAGTVSYGIKRAYLRVIRDLEGALAPSGFTPPLLAALAIVAANPGISPARLAAAMGHGRSRAAPLLDHLEGQGLLTRRAGPDRRSIRLHLTATGRAALRRLKSIVAEHEVRITAGLTTQEAGGLPDMLERVAEGKGAVTLR
ncbi:MarR family winged helix-turn-helix transcriptional regulator [Roseomonas xinghualingensis]|uniref:MarR family winged helix-turn-helix transcriptional regulator n=1 Tax=Roseomonas xinghualingensis TaxID=2986475 RepID=UPI0021F24CFC|nr:MarR family transcriptional regulator [Roseomonas sp. SXEYE001]MCV4210144.1 MarR family transcriptional regulator [Roseomonas sp. SXEYE001]